MRSFVLVLLCTSMTILATAPAYADPTSDMVAMGQAFAGVHSYHADITTSKGTMSMDMVAPDKLHMTMNGKMQMIRIGDDMWVNAGGQWQHVPMMAGGMVQRPMEMARNAGMSASGPSDYQITDLGPAMLDGVLTHKYHMVGKTGDTVDMWISKNLPLQVQATGKDGTATIKYSEYNSVPDITPPA